MRRLLDAVRPDPPEHDPIRRMFMRMLAPASCAAGASDHAGRRRAGRRARRTRTTSTLAVELSEHFVLNVDRRHRRLPSGGPRATMPPTAHGDEHERAAQRDTSSRSRRPHSIAGSRRRASARRRPGGVAELVLRPVDRARSRTRRWARCSCACSRPPRSTPPRARSPTRSTTSRAIRPVAPGPRGPLARTQRLPGDDPLHAGDPSALTAPQPREPARRPDDRGGDEDDAAARLANRDPRVFENPDVFDIRRDASAQLGFGSGIHSCAGQTLARLEGEAVLGALARRVADLRLDGEPTRRVHNTLHTWASCP